MNALKHHISLRILAIAFALTIGCAAGAEEASVSAGTPAAEPDSMSLVIVSPKGFKRPKAAKPIKYNGERYRVDTLSANRHLVYPPVSPDSLDVMSYRHKSFWRAGATVVGFNLGLSAFNRYIKKGHYAYISWHTIKENFKHGFVFDDDNLITNMFAHPYHGNLYFNAARSNGFNFWQSELFAIGGSLMWELFMENEYPSTNDVIATPVGGAAMGEVLYRTSDLLIDDRAAGWERFGREAAVFILSPMRGFTRIVTGRAWAHRATRGRRFGLPPISVELGLGMRMLSMHDYRGTTKVGGAMQIHLQYGNKYAETSMMPYDYFSLFMELNGMDTQPLVSRVEIIGRLLSRTLVDNPRCQLSLGLYQHFDYFDSDTITRKTSRNPADPCAIPYKLGTPASVGVGAMVRYLPVKGTRIEGFMHFNGVALAGVLTDFYRDYHRDYNYGSGFSVKTGLSLSVDRQRLNFSVANQYYWLYTRNGPNSYKNMADHPAGQPTGLEGDNGHARFNHFEATTSYRLFSRFYLTLGFDFYKRITNYGDMEFRDKPLGFNNRAFKIKSTQYGMHAMLTYKF